MKDHARRQLEAAAILMASAAGEADEADLATLDAWLREDPGLAALVVDLMHQESWLSWQGSNLLQSAPDPADAARPELAASRPAAGPTPRAASSGPRTTRPLALAVAAALLLATGAILGSFAARWRQPAAGNADFVATSSSSDADPPRSPRYVARFVQGTACLWNSETTAPFALDDPLRSGESLNLLEGLAEVRFDWSGGAANLKLEGPAGLVLTAERGANLSRGRLTADIQPSPQQGDGKFVLETPNGEIEAARDAAIGVAVRGEVVELHVFRGAATFVTPWPNSGESEDRLEVLAGQSLDVASDVEGRTRVDRGAARPEDFASQISMGSDELPITDQYIHEVLDAQPLVYWRFEGDAGAAVPNEVGDRYEGRVVGAVNWVNQRGNRDVELGAGLAAEALHAYIVAAEPLAADFRDGYSIEMWIKPSHYHWGTVVSLIGEPPQTGGPNGHGMLFELGGPVTWPSSIEQPGKFRFLHRSPPSDDLTRGTSCFSDTPYELRRWQHVAAVKDGAEMRLYVNGRLVATGQDATELPSGLTLIVGQLDEVRVDRRFVGQLDELAIYARPLTAEEVHRRYELIRNPPQPPKRPDPRAI
jgi:hypothetical protein